MNYYTYELSVGRTTIVEEKDIITEISIAPLLSEKPIREGNEKETVWIRQAAVELTEYLLGKRMQFSIPLAPQGTVFQKQVWDALLTIPYGETRSYMQIAEQIGKPKAARAVGMANNKNPIIIVIPCHRVIGANGSLVGYGMGLPMKEKLLQLEKKKPMV